MSIDYYDVVTIKVLGKYPPRTYTNGEKRLNFILGDAHVNNSVRACGPLTEHGGLISDHTAQWVGLNVTLLFGSTNPSPARHHKREFTMKNPLKKHEFQDKFGENAAQHKLSKKVQILRDGFAKFD